ncbi:glycoside hydrolase family 9 protein [Kribbella sp. NBC_01245]|uniref:glycoside hydrolase family 9 protein n=1 Tax=Kribbella sp. NBC_01245 TaxID=2903578 RepID=UPI002E2BD774|nr:glycoside hydrolase family 9 protein [Kribbella sp. NBC_01245]
MRLRDEKTPGILVPHLGYGIGAGQAVIAVVPDRPLTAELLAPGGTVALEPGPVERVPGWTGGPYSRIPLPDNLATGTYAVRVVVDGVELRSEPFVVGPERLQRQTMSDVLAYFKAMRSSGEIDRKDRAARCWDDDSGATVDARGGWLDASGDTSKFLSHLTYTSTMSPQQIPLCAWAMLAARDDLVAQHPALAPVLSARLRDEALWGADFLTRFRSPEGYFYTGIFDALTKRLEERVITAPLQNSVRTSRYQAAYRHGGGLAIAALARASTVDDDGDHTRADYLAAARDGFAHLEKHNLAYLFDGTESIIDDYTALLAATELAAADGSHQAAREAACRRAASLTERYVRPGAGVPGWFRADEQGRPFFHAAEPGLPMLALLRFADVLPDAPEVQVARATAVQAMLDILDRTASVPNPFGYPRGLVQPYDESPREAFFFPHANETGYWWQGENAAIASLSAAASACARLDGLAEDLRARLTTFAADQLSWIVGRNPFDSSMLQGRGRNNADYSSDFPNLPGGIVNGITSGWTDENDLAFLPPDAPEGDAWRWAEQWIPHTGWFLLAVATAG